MAKMALKKFSPGLFIFLLFSSFFLAGCSTTKSPSDRYAMTHDNKPHDFEHFNVDSVPNATPKVEPRSKYGNPASYEVFGKRYNTLTSANGYSEQGIASWYGIKFHAARTSSGEPYDMYAMTAAHKTLPLPTYVRVTNLQSGKSIIVKVNDRGPFVTNRIIDLSFVAAKKLGVTQKGTAYVRVDALDTQHPENSKPAAPAQYYQQHQTQVYLQLGAFSTHDAAANMVNRIKEITSRTTHIVMDQQPNKLLYKVQIGPLAGVEEVDALTATFKQNGLGEAFAVVR